jgi:hypothetical protein
LSLPLLLLVLPRCLFPSFTRVVGCLIQLATDRPASFAGLHRYFVRSLSYFARGSVGVIVPLLGGFAVSASGKQNRSQKQ